MSTQQDPSLFKSFFQYAGLNIAFMLGTSIVLWILSMWLPLWAIAVLIIAVFAGVLLFGNRQDPAKRAAMSEKVKPLDK